MFSDFKSYAGTGMYTEPMSRCFMSSYCCSLPNAMLFNPNIRPTILRPLAVYLQHRRRNPYQKSPRDRLPTLQPLACGILRRAVREIKSSDIAPAYAVCLDWLGGEEEEGKKLMICSLALLLAGRLGWRKEKGAYQAGQVPTPSARIPPLVKVSQQQDKPYKHCH